MDGKVQGKQTRKREQINSTCPSQAAYEEPSSDDEFVSSKDKKCEDKSGGKHLLIKQLGKYRQFLETLKDHKLATNRTQRTRKVDVEIKCS